MAHSDLVELIEVIEEEVPDLPAAARRDIVELGSPGATTARAVLRRRSLTPAAAQRLLDARAGPGLVIADLIDSVAAETLRRAGWSYWDRRGRLRLWLPEIGVRLDLPARACVTGADGPDPRRPVTGVGGISFALGLLLRPDHPAGVRAIARMSEMAPSTISRARRRLIQAALVDSDGTAVVPELFWATSDAWVVRPVVVDTPPDSAGWILGGDAAAAVWGASALAGAERYYCADRAVFDRHRLRHADEGSAIQIAVAPTPLVIASAIEGVAHPVVAALDLSTSVRGREILADWATIAPEAVGAEVVWQ